jgi:hypothetical protein
MRIVGSLWLLLLSQAYGSLAASPAPRRIRIDGQQFVISATNEPVVMSGPNVVVKASPYLPATSGDTMCNDIVNDECTATGTCQTCFTFNEYDIANLKAQGWNTIRLGVVWAGAQPTDEYALDPDFVARLQAGAKFSTHSQTIHINLLCVCAHLLY